MSGTICARKIEQLPCECEQCQADAFANAIEADAQPEQMEQRMVTDAMIEAGWDTFDKGGQTDRDFVARIYLAMQAARPTPDLGDDGELVERLNRRIKSTGAWMTSDLRELYTEIRDRLILYREALNAAAALVAKLDECAPAIANLSVTEFVRSGKQYAGPSYGEALEALRAVLSRSRG